MLSLSRPLLPRAAALCRRLCRFSKFQDGGVAFLEPAPSPPVRKTTSYQWRKNDKERTKAAHVKLVNRLNADNDIVIYTDGSAIPNPGRIGLGVSARCGDTLTTYGKPIGIGSNITAELCAIHSAIVTTLQTDVSNFKRVFIFSDCQTAIDLSLKRCTPMHSFTLVSNIQSTLQQLKAKLQVTILWVPAHVGVPGNEAANTAAQNAATAVPTTSPILGQPLIPLSTSRAFIKSALKERLQRRWFKTVAEKVGLDHLTRLRADVSAAPAFWVGTRRQQTILARLRLGTCGLNFSRSRLLANVNEECDCGKCETVRHFLLECPRFETARSELVKNIRTIHPGIINEDLLLGGGGVDLSLEHWEIVVSSVEKYVLSSKRSI